MQLNSTINNLLIFDPADYVIPPNENNGTKFIF